MEKLGRGVRVRRDAGSELGKVYAGRLGEIEQFTRDGETGAIKSYTVRLDDGTTQITLEPSEVDLLD